MERENIMGFFILNHILDTSFLLYAYPDFNFLIISGSDHPSQNNSLVLLFLVRCPALLCTQVFGAS